MPFQISQLCKNLHFFGEGCLIMCFLVFLAGFSPSIFQIQINKSFLKYNKFLKMKASAIILAIAMIITLTTSGVIFGQFDPILTVRQSSGPHHFQANGQIPEVFQWGTITVPKQQWFVELHGLAYKQLTYLYPAYRTFAVRSCAYTVYGPSRIYVYELANGAGQTVKLFSSVQNNEQATGEQTQQAVAQQSKAQIYAKQENTLKIVTDQNSGFNVIKLSRAYQIPRVAIAIKQITRNHWRSIRSAPLVRCLQRWERGTYSFRLFFNGVSNWFEYRHLGHYVSKAEQIEVVRSDVKVETPASVAQPSIPKVADNEDYLPRQKPIFSVKNTDLYDGYSWTSFRKHAGYKSIVQKFNEHFGRFDEKWVSKIQYKVDTDVHYFQFQVKFVPFLLDVDLEAHYYGSTQKASILQIDQKVFNGNDNQKYFNSWNEIKDFESYKSFRQANEYVLSQFTYLRFYKVTGAYSALHKNGRYVRLVYESSNNFFSTKGEYQFNILVYINDGKFYIDREDFHATNTYSFGKNDWISFFIKVEDVNTHQDYHRIVKFFKTEHLQFWHAHRVEQLRFKDGVYVVKFRNPSSLIPVVEQEKHCVLSVTNRQVNFLHHFDWKRVNQKSVEHTKAVSYVHEKFNASVPMFVKQKVSPYGRHFEVSYLNEKKAFVNHYLRWVDAEGLFCEDQWQGVAYEIDFSVVPLPVNAEDQLVNWIVDNEDGIIAVVEVKAQSKSSYQCIAIGGSNRWRLNVNWVKGQWVINSRQIINDGYYFLTGYPSVNVASCTGYLARLYPTSFASQWVYGSIQVKNIGFFVYNRVVYRIGNKAYQGIVRTTHGVENSHTLISWDEVRHLRHQVHYGYGENYDWSYGFEPRFFFDYEVRPRVNLQIEVQVVSVDKTDLLCSFWDDNKCIACYGDYYANNSGSCIRVQQECQFWKVSGICSRCSYGWSVNTNGKCRTIA